MSPLIRRFDPADEYYFEEGCYIHELSNSPDDPLMSVARARLPLGGQTPQRVSAGDVVVIPAGCPQRIRCVGEQPLVFLAICTPRFEPACYENVDA